MSFLNSWSKGKFNWEKTLPLTGIIEIDFIFNDGICISGKAYDF